MFRGVPALIRLPLARTSQTCRAILWATLFGALGLASAESQPAPWKQYRSPLNDFSALFPGSPETETSAKKGIEVHTYSSQLGACFYRVDVYAYAPNYFPGWNGYPETFLDHSEKSQLEGTGLTLRAGSERAVAAQAFPGREFVGESAKYAVRQRMYLWGKPPEGFSEYHLKAFCLKGSEDQQLSTLFLDSFRLLASPPQLAPWKAFSSSDDHFSVTFPRDPQTTNPVGANGLPTRQYAAPYGTSAYMVGVFVYPYNSIDYTGFPDSMLEATQKGGLTAAKMTARAGSQKAITLQGRPGREYIGDGPAYTVKVRVFLRGKPPQDITVYQVMVASPKDSPVESSVTQFLDSFKILD